MVMVWFSKTLEAQQSVKVSTQCLMRFGRCAVARPARPRTFSSEENDVLQLTSTGELDAVSAMASSSLCNK